MHGRWARVKTSTSVVAVEHVRSAVASTGCVRFVAGSEILNNHRLGVSKNKGTPKWMVYNGNHIKMDDLGIPLFLETPTWGVWNLNWRSPDFWTINQSFFFFVRVLVEIGNFFSPPFSKAVPSTGHVGLTLQIVGHCLLVFHHWITFRLGY